MIIKTNKYRDDLSTKYILNDTTIIPDVIKVSKLHSFGMENGEISKSKIAEQIEYITKNQEDSLYILHLENYDEIDILNDNGKLLYNFFPLHQQKNSDGSPNKTTSASKDESGEVNK